MSKKLAVTVVCDLGLFAALILKIIDWEQFRDPFMVINGGYLGAQGIADAAERWGSGGARAGRVSKAAEGK